MIFIIICNALLIFCHWLWWIFKVLGPIPLCYNPRGMRSSGLYSFRWNKVRTNTPRWGWDDRLQQVYLKHNGLASTLKVLRMYVCLNIYFQTNNEKQHWRVFIKLESWLFYQTWVLTTRSMCLLVFMDRRRPSDFKKIEMK